MIPQQWLGTALGALDVAFWVAALIIEVLR
jgi:hypothetical protein